MRESGKGAPAIAQVSTELKQIGVDVDDGSFLEPTRFGWKETRMSRL